MLSMVSAIPQVPLAASYEHDKAMYGTLPTVVEDDEEDEDEGVYNEVVEAPLKNLVLVGEGPNVDAKACQCGTYIDVFVIETYMAQRNDVLQRLKSFNDSRRMYTFAFKVGDVSLFEFSASFSEMRQYFKPVWPDFPSKYILRDYSMSESNVLYRAEELRCYFETNLNRRSRGEEVSSPRLLAAFGITSHDTISALKDVAATRKLLLFGQCEDCAPRNAQEEGCER